MREVTSKQQTIFNSVHDNVHQLRTRGSQMSRAGLPLLAFQYRKAAADLESTLALQRRQVLEPERMLDFHGSEPISHSERS